MRRYRIRFNLERACVRMRKPADAAAKGEMKVSYFNSLRVRILVIVFVFLAVVLMLFTANTITEFEKTSKANIGHEGMLLSNMLEAVIADLAFKKDIPGIQAYIDRVVALRAQNDIEINVIFPAGEKSEIVASNDRGNIEETDSEEHQAMLESLKFRRPVLLIDTTSIQLDPDDDPNSRSDPTHIDYYIKPGHRFMSIMTPLIVKQQNLGSINVQLSLGSLDMAIRALYSRILITMSAGLLVLATGISLYLNKKLFSPLLQLAANIFDFGAGRLASVSFDSQRRDEIGVINSEFASMVTRIRDAEAANQVYLQEIERQKDEVEKLLLNILPPSVIERLHTNETMIADAHNGATVLFADLVGFTQYAALHSPEQVVKVLNEVFFRFDNLAQEHGVEKIKTIGDAYMGVAGVPLSCPDHAERAARTALGMVDAIRDMNKEGICDFRIRIGLHAGALVAGVIGKHKFSYDVWGDTVNIAKRYESASEPGRIHISSAVASALSASFETESRGHIAIKDVGMVESFFLNRPRSRQNPKIL